ncbi:MAG: hypothetical protein L3V56_03390 [Candidatus Magnetoovum sp. WYHC-5]|nr:hypothetical protein [Candidatus Magnetoovum sp. WYHC-5]
MFSKMFKGFSIAILLALFAANAYASSVTGVIVSIDFKKGIFIVKSKQADMGFSCEPSLLSNIIIGDKVKVQYVIENSVENVQTIERIAPLKNSKIIGEIIHIDMQKGTLTLKSEDAEVVLDGGNAELKDYKQGDIVDITYTINDSKEVIKTIKKKQP